MPPWRITGSAGFEVVDDMNAAFAARKGWRAVIRWAKHSISLPPHLALFKSPLHGVLRTAQRQCGSLPRRREHGCDELSGLKGDSGARSGELGVEQVFDAVASIEKSLMVENGELSHWFGFQLRSSDSTFPLRITSQTADKRMKPNFTAKYAIEGQTTP